MFQTFSRNDLPGEAALARGRYVFQKKKKKEKKRKRKKEKVGKKTEKKRKKKGEKIWDSFPSISQASASGRTA